MRKAITEDYIYDLYIGKDFQNMTNRFLEGFPIQNRLGTVNDNKTHLFNHLELTILYNEKIGVSKFDWDI